MTRSAAASQPTAVSRRHFLSRACATAGLAASAPLVVSASVLGRDGAVAPSNRVTVGLIGVGRQAYYANLPGFLRQADAQVVALCDVDSWRVEEGRKKVQEHRGAQTRSGQSNSCSVHRDFRDLLARGDLDAVMISTPDHWHVPMAVAAVKAGKDVCCEKPLTRSIAEGRGLSDLVKREKRVFRTDSEFRSMAKFHRAVELVRNGRIGKLHTIRVTTPLDTGGVGQPAPTPAPPELDYALWLGPAPEAPYTEHRVHPRHKLQARPGWLRISDYADGMLANWGAHLNDIAQWGNDTERTGPISVEGTAEFPPANELWNVVLKFEVEFRFANGVKLLCRTASPAIRFEGSEGWVQVGYPNDLEAEPEAILSWKPGSNDQTWPLKDEKRDFLDAIKSRGQTLEDAEVGHRVTSLAHLAMVAVRLGKRMEWDPDKERFRDDEANQLLLRRGRAPWAV